MKNVFLGSLATLVAAGVAFADTIVFDFEDPKGVNNVLFLLDAPLEQISGSASGISGTVTGHPDNPAEVEGKIVVDTTSLQVPNPVMQEHLHSEDWLHSGKHSEISFELKSVDNITKDGEKGTADATGMFTLNGISKEITVPISAHYLPGRLKERSGQEGDLLVLRSQFSIKRSDFGIKPGEMEDKVSDEIQITLNVAGSAPKK